MSNMRLLFQSKPPVLFLPLSRASSLVLLPFWLLTGHFRAKFDYLLIKNPFNRPLDQNPFDLRQNTTKLAGA